MTIEVRCEKCARRVRITRQRASEERSEALKVRIDYAAQCPENRVNGSLSCPMAQPEEVTEKAA